MIFRFEVLGLFISYFLLCLYVFNTNIKKKNIFYKSLLICCFVSQLFYLISFVFLNINNIILSKLFIRFTLSSLLIFITMLFGYIYSKHLSIKYSMKESIIFSKSKTMFISLLAISILFSLYLFTANFDIIDSFIISGAITRYVYLYSLFFIIISFLFMIFNVFKLNKKMYLSLYVPVGISLFLIILQSGLYKAGFVVSGYSFIVLYIYVMLENPDVNLIEHLKVAKISAETDNEKKSKFLEKLSREIRTPISTIDGFSQVILNEKNIDNIKEDARDIRIASTNLVDLINGIMDISMIESGKMEIKNRDYDTLEMLESISSVAKNLINKEKIKFNVSYGENIPKVLNGDSEKIKRVLLNLLSNASQYTEKGEINFKVTAVNNGNICRLIMSVSDTGKGIPKEEMNNIFHKYDSVNNKNGNGLGLAIASNLLDLMNGKIDVDSVVGEGSTFTITIDQKVISNESITLSNEDKGEIKTFDASGKRIIIVDDNKLNLKVASKLLIPYGVEVVMADSGEEFLDLMGKDHNFDLVLMDDMMPKMSGTETLDTFRKIERIDGYNIPVVVLTANAVSGMKDKYLDKGFEDYLAKPIDKFELNRILKKYLKR